MKTNWKGSLLCALLLFVQGASANTITGPQRVNASDAQQGDGFGTSISLGGNYIAVGAAGDDQGAGAVYIYKYDGNNWTETQRLVANDREPSQQFGFSVSVSGNRLAIGAPSAKNGANVNAGAVYIFERNGNTWTQVAKVTANDGALDDLFGFPVSLDGDLLAVGAYGDDVAVSGGSAQNAGSVYIFERSGAVWNQQQRLNAPSPLGGAWFGYALALENNRLIVGAPFHDIGRAYIYQRSGATFSLSKELQAPAGDNLQPFSEFGIAVSLSGATAAVGADRTDFGANDSGSVYVFVQNLSGDWVQQVRLSSPSPTASGRFGGGVSIKGDLLLAGAIGQDAQRGAGYLFRRVDSGWSFLSKLQPADSALDDLLGVPVLVTDDFALLGARFNDILGPASGSAWIYKVYAPPVGVFKDIFGSMRAGIYPSAAIPTAGGVFQSNMGAGASNNGRVVIAARDASGGIWANSYNAANNTFGNTQYLGGVAQGDPSVAFLENGTAVIAIRDNFQAVSIRTFLPGTGSGVWRGLGGVFASDPATAACPDGSVYLVARDTFNGMWSGRYIPATDTWGGWQFFGGIVKGQPSVACGTDNAAYVGIRDAFDGIYIARVMGDNLTGWFFGQGIASIDPRVAASGGKIFLTILDSFGALYYRVFEEGTGNGWQNWNFVGGVFEAIAPAAVNHELYVVGRAAASTKDLYWWRETGNTFTYIDNANQTAGLITGVPR